MQWAVKLYLLGLFLSLLSALFGLLDALSSAERGPGPWAEPEGGGLAEAPPRLLQGRETFGSYL